MAKKPDSFYFDNYVACADLAVQAAELLTQIFENFDPAQIHDILNKMHAIEHAADKKHHELEDALLTAFITPLGRAAQLPQVQDPARTRHPDQHHRVRSRRALYQRHAQPAR